MMSYKYFSSNIGYNVGDDFPTFVMPDISDTVLKEIVECDACQRTKRSIKIHGKIPC